MPIKIIKNSFNSGEVSELLSGRTDLAKYFNSCSELVNGIPLPQGGVVKRSGTKFVARTKMFSDWATGVVYPVGCVVISSGKYWYCLVEHTSTTDGAHDAENTTDWVEVEDIPSATNTDSKAKLFSFEFSVDDTHILEFGIRYMRVYKDGARVFESTTNTVAGVSLVSGSRVVITTSASHGWTTGNTVKFADVGGTTELNGKEYVITYKDADEFYLDGTDGDDFTAWTADGTISKVYEITTPYNSTEAFEIHTAQSGDVLYISHEDHHPQKLTRLGDASWTLADVGFTGGPFLTENADPDDTLTFTADSKFTGTHTGANNQAILTDAAGGWVADELIGLTIYNTTDGSSGEITDNDATTVTATLSGGTDDDWDTGDTYYIGISGYYINEDITGTLEATGCTPFNSSHVGSRWLIKNTRADNRLDTFDNDADTTPTGTGILIKGDFNLDVEVASGNYDIKLWRKAKNGNWQEYRSFQATSAYSSTETEDDVYYTITRNNASAGTAILTGRDQIHRGIVEITEVTDSNTAIAKVIDSVYRSGASGLASPATAMWAEGAWSDYRGYPRTVTFYENRLYWAGSTNNPSTLWGSVTGEYENHETSDEDDGALVLPIIANDVSQIQWIAAKKVLAVGSASTELIVSATNPDDPLTATDKKSVPQSNFGSYNIQPTLLNGGLFYLQRQGRKLRVMTFDYVTDSYKSEDATMLASHILESQPTCMAASQIPDSMLWVVRQDGTLCAFVYEPGEQVFAAWARIVTGSSLLTPVEQFESVAVVHGDTEDSVYVIVARTIEEATVRYIEYFAPRLIDVVDDAVCVDSAVVGDSGYSAQNIVYASDTVRYGDSYYGNGIYGV